MSIELLDTPKRDVALRINIGSGSVPIPGYVSVDRKLGGEAYPLTLPDGLLDANGDKTPVSDNSVDELHCSHVWEHFSHTLTYDVLANWTRCLKPGGTLKIAVPDIDRIISARAEGIPIPFEQYIMGGHIDSDDQHGALFDEQTTTAMMRHVGLRNIRRWKSTQRDCASLPISLNLMGTKRGPVDCSGTVAVMTVPRIGFTDNYRGIIETVKDLGMHFIQTGGAYWDKGITTAIEDAITHGAKRILAIDYDTLFYAHNVEELIWLSDTTGYDAICPVQVQRGKNRMLVNLMGPDGEPMDNPTVGDLEAEVVPLCSGHFGLTVIKASAMEKVPKPWLRHEHDADGRFGPEAYDADIVFWKNFTKAGLKVGMASHVAVGHAELLATWPRQDFQPIYQHLDEYRAKGPPINVRR